MSGWYRAHETEGWNPRSGEGPLQACRRQDVHADEFHDRRMRRRIPAGWEFPEGEDKIRRGLARFNRFAREFRPESTLKPSAVTRNAMRDAAKTTERHSGQDEALPHLLEDPSNTVRDAARFGACKHNQSVNL